MRTTHAGHLLYLHCRKTLSGILPLFFLLALAHTTLHAQYKQGNRNYLDFQSKPYYFGITLGYNQSDFKIVHSKEFVYSDSISRAESVTGPGFNLGIVSNLKLGEYFDVRFLPTLSFVERNIRYAPPGESARTTTRSVQSVFVEMPLQVRYKSAPYHDFRLFLVSGDL